MAFPLSLLQNQELIRSLRQMYVTGRVQAHAPTLAAREAETRPADSASTRPSRAGKAKTQKGTLDRGQPGTERRMGRWSPDKAISHNTTE